MGERGLARGALLGLVVAAVMLTGCLHQAPRAGATTNESYGSVIVLTPIP